MNIETDRLLLKQISVKDSSEISKIVNDKEINYFTYYWPYPSTEKKIKKIITKLEKEWKDEKTVVMFKIVLRTTNKIIGVIDLYDINRLDKNAKVGYLLGREFWGKGYAKEALLNAIKFAFGKLNLSKLSADTLTDNKSSIKLLEKVGFRRVGIMKKDKLVNGNLKDRYLWELIKKV